MTRLLFILVFAGISFQSCASGEANKTAGKNPDSIFSGMPADDGAASVITRDQFLKEVWNYQESPEEWKFLGNKPVIIDFYADWCGPCRIASPILEEIAGEYRGKITVYKIDTDKERELAGIFGIQSIPAFLYIPLKGKPVMTAGIGQSKEQTKKMFTENISKYLLKD